MQITYKNFLKIISCMLEFFSWTILCLIYLHKRDCQRWSDALLCSMLCKPQEQGRLEFYCGRKLRLSSSIFKKWIKMCNTISCFFLCYVHLYLLKHSLYIFFLKQFYVLLVLSLWTYINIIEVYCSVMYPLYWQFCGRSWYYQWDTPW